MQPALASVLRPLAHATRPRADSSHRSTDSSKDPNWSSSVVAEASRQSEAERESQRVGERASLAFAAPQLQRCRDSRVEHYISRRPRCRGAVASADRFPRIKGSPNNHTIWARAPWARAPSSTPWSTPTARRAPRRTSARRPRAARRPPPKRKRPSRRRSAPPAAKKGVVDVLDVGSGTVPRSASAATGAHTETIVRELRKSAAGKYATRTGARKARRPRSWRDEGATRGFVAFVVGQLLLLESCKVAVLVAVERT